MPIPLPFLIRPASVLSRRDGKGPVPFSGGSSYDRFVVPKGRRPSGCGGPDPGAGRLCGRRTPLYLAIGDRDSYYGPASLEEIYAALHDLYAGQSLTEEEIGRLLVLDVRGQTFFSSHGFSDQHAGGQAFAHDPDVMGWLFAHQRQQGQQTRP